LNFFEHQEAARRSSTRLVLLFTLAVAAIVGAVDVVVWLASGSVEAVVAASLLTGVVIGLGSLYRIASLRGGGAAVAAQLGGTWVPEDTRDPALRRLRNVVEEVAIASGVPVPRLFVLEQEAGINAFAAGYGTADAAIAVTRGALDRLNRDELQAVIAHEFSHILNGDMRLNIRLMGVLFGIMMLSLIGQRILLHAPSVRGRNSNASAVLAVMLAALVAIVIGSLGVFFGRLIQAAVSRQREYLADASAVQFPRQPAALAGALKKIAGLHAGARLEDRAGAGEVAHMLFAQGFHLAGWMATHPPLLERIRRLDPSFDARQLQALQARWAATPPDGMAEDLALGLVAAGDVRPPPLPAAGAEVEVASPTVARQVAAPADDDYDHAHALAASLDPELCALARRRDSAMAVLAALLLEADPELAGRQRALLAERCGPALAEQAQAVHERHLAGLHPMLRLPLAALAFPALRQRPRPELDAFLAAADAMVHADGRVSVFEYCLGRLLQVQVREALDPARHARFGRRKAPGVRAEFATLLAVLAEAGHPGDPDGARRAYLAGLQRVLPRDHLPYAPPAAGVQALDVVWEPLDALAPPAKQVLVEALVDAVSHDGRVTVAEAELLRTVCAVLHCPLPALLSH